MRRLCILIFVLCCTAAPAALAARTLLVVGDSLSAAYGMDPRQGWVALLQQRLDRERRPLRVVNASITGDTTANGLERLPRLLDRHRPDIVVIELGGNDGLRGLSPRQMHTNIVTMIQKAKARRALVLLVGIELPPNYGQVYIEKFRRLYRDIAREQQVPLVPFLLDGVATRAEYMQADGLHPNARAQPKILEIMWTALLPLLATTSPTDHSKATGRG